MNFGYQAGEKENKEKSDSGKVDPSSLKTDSDILSASEAAAYLRMHRNTLYQKSRLGIIPGSRKTGRWLYSKQVLQELVKAG